MDGITLNNFNSDKICSILVLFYPDENQISVLVNALIDKCNVILVDNTPNLINNNLCLLTKKESNLYYLPQQINKGIAEAQNIGIEYAKTIKQIDYLLFLDQDSIIPDHFVNQMISEYIRISNLGVKIGALGPTPINRDTNIAYKRERLKRNDLAIGYSMPSTLISSGMLIAKNTIKSVGLMESNLFIDAVDFEWCWRSRSMGFICCMTENVKMLHKVGEQDKSFFGYSVLLASPIRYYYQYRNFILLFNRSYVPLNWKLKGILKKIFIIVYVPLMANKGMECLKYMIKGIKAGVIHK